MARDKDEKKEEMLTPEIEENHAELRAYELSFHIDSELPQVEAKKSYESIKDLIAANGTVIAEGEPNKIQLAYTISRMETGGRRDFTSAYFGWIAYETDGKGHEAVLESTRNNSHVVRFLDLRTTKEGAKHSAEMHEFYRRAPEATDQTPEEPAEAELDAALREAGVA